MQIIHLISQISNDRLKIDSIILHVFCVSIDLLNKEEYYVSDTMYHLKTITPLFRNFINHVHCQLQKKT